MMIGYVLLTVTWLFVLTYILYPWIKFGAEPPFWLWIILIALAVVPLANRLRLGNWLDFSRKVESLEKDVSSIKSDIVEIHNRMDLTNVQSQQQFNISLLTEKAAKAFASHFAQPARLLNRPIVFEKEDDSDYCVIESISPTDTRRFNFIQAADEALNHTEPLIYILYSLVLTKRDKKSPEAEALFSKTPPEVVQELQDESVGMAKTIWSGSADIKNSLRTIANLYKLREDVVAMSTEPPSQSKEKEILSEAARAVGYFSGVLIAFAESFITADAILKDGKLRFYKPSKAK